MAASDNLRKAKATKNNEFYTRLEDIEAEISSHSDYIKHFQGKVVFCNCDDPEWSSFYEFFRQHFKQLGLKKLITTHYNKDGSPSYKLEWSGEMLGEDTVNMIKTPLKGNGDFRSDECVEILKEADIIVTNPPFSEITTKKDKIGYISLLEKYGKKYVLIINKNNVANKEIFPLFRDNKLWLGYNESHGSMNFATEVIGDTIGGQIQSVASYWCTNLSLDKNNEPKPLNKNYKGNEDKYIHYDNFDAIDCGHFTSTGNWVGDLDMIPKDYDGVMGVPITFLENYCPNQFEIIGVGTGNLAKEIGITKNYRGRTDLAITIDGKPSCPFNRILIRKKKGRN